MNVHTVVSAERQRLRVPALGAAVVDADGHVSAEVAGVRRRGRDDDPAIATDRWHIGSCGKSITAALYARLVQAGRARWSAPLPELFTDLELHPGWQAATIDQLLLNTSGAPAIPPRRRWLAYFGDTRPPAQQRTEAAAEMFATAPVGAGRFRYSNLGYAVAGAAIERIAGEPYEAALRTHLLDPLGITSAGFGPPPEIRGHFGRLRLGNLVLGRGRPTEPGSRFADNPSFVSPTGRLHLTLADWSRFLRLFLTRAGDDVLTTDSVRRLLTVAPDGPYAMGWAPVQRLEGISFGQQGSNTHWVATALLDADRRRAAMVVVNDGRTAMFGQTARLAGGLLGASS